MSHWTMREAVDLCRAVEAVCPPFGCHVALTGGVLYKQGERKDLDILFYRVRQVSHVDRAGLFAALKGLGLVKLYGWGWCYKATYQGKPVDLFFPDQSWPVSIERWHMRAVRWVRQRVLRMSA